ncbi:Hexaprenyldihydroxybenzoate methyltransferase [Taphrina deformans PYCC 5710]|uniref:Ubiquinone biosynthesis O-methyltransferase, mitochondrial n=1 Tax=Taphrina deformans (strain PYCC 5710 / ATCC 11124 / CBS 356.35 / IMI 108563 / JCM 9778 / NBRC 8474) TaxID=1097556 RepID=R4X927_TAPDE|nr:Hexaprenyldihydroxybenzoate methyltransferase [Taphrina deformans PYCC 5710]|eukprot:CCG81930.1 Hexaprenyldihydroxybenzoate methyltransferase [Taphrina deformans PYCC 5710]
MVGKVTHRTTHSVGRRHMSAETKRKDSSVSAEEIKHFDSLAATWWDTSGSSGLLHKMNPARIGFIKSHLTASLFPSDLARNGPLWLSGKRTLDVGCGGGILSEALTRVGGRVTGVDASTAGILVAKEHAKQMGLSVEYLHTSVEQLAPERSESYDVVCAMEILEHVSSPPTFLRSVLQLLKPGGMLFVSTIEKTWFARLLTCTIAEDVLRLVPKGTHKYEKFVPKEAMVDWSRELGAEVVDTRGIIFDPLAGTWRVLGRNQPWGEACNYIMAIKKL